MAHWAGKGSRPALLVVAGLGLALGGLVAVGHLTREALRGQERYTLPFTAIDCPPPPGQDRAGFLAEVRYLSEAPEQLHLLDDDLSRRLAAAFARHPRVEKVERVEVLPPRTVRVRLVYRNRP